MNTLQPNFEVVKTAFYQSFVNSNKATYIIMLQGIATGDFRSFNKKETEFKKDFNNWLDSIDIRCASQLVKEIAKVGGKLPKWILNNSYTIDYNEHNFLDLIKIHAENY